MNEAHRNVLQRHLRQLANDIILTDDLTAALFQHRIFERNMIELIKSEKTATDQVYKMLELLPKRGPDAFDTFVQIIENDYPWLAAMLASTDTKETRPSRMDSYKSESESPKTNMIEIPEPEQDIKQRVSVFVHKQFGQSKRISENDKKGMVKWFSQQIQLERKRVCHSASSEHVEQIPLCTTVDASCGTEEDDQENPQAELNKRAQKVLEKIEELKKKSSGVKNKTPVEKPGSSLSMNSTDSCVDCLTPNVMDIVFEELEFLVNKIDQLESEINKCHMMMGDKDKKMSLSLLIYNMSLTSKQHVKDLNLEKQKSEKMLNEIYDFSKKVNKFEQIRSQQKALIDQNNEEIEKLQEENERLKGQVEKLEKLHSLHTEKQKTLENLRNMVKELQQDKLGDGTGVCNVPRTSTDRRGSISKRTGVRIGVPYTSRLTKTSGSENTQTSMFNRKYQPIRSPVKKRQGYNPNANSSKF